MAAKKRTDEDRKSDFEALITARFAPVDQISLADHFFSTQQIFLLAEEHSPDMLPQRLVRKFMLELGFVERMIGGSFMWLLADTK